MEALELSDVDHDEEIGTGMKAEALSSISNEDELRERKRKNIVSLPASVFNGRREALIQEEDSKRCLSEFPQLAKEVKQENFTVQELNETSKHLKPEKDKFRISILDESKGVDNQQNLPVQEEQISREIISATNKTEEEQPSITENQRSEVAIVSKLSEDSVMSKNDDSSTTSNGIKSSEERTSEKKLDVSKEAFDNKSTPVETSSDKKNDSSELEMSSEEKKQSSKNEDQKIASLKEESIYKDEESSDCKQIRVNGNMVDDQEPTKKNLSFSENQEPEDAMLRKKDPTKENATKVFRESYFMKTKGKIYFKKKGPFSKWRSQFVILDDNKQQMCFFKSQEEYEKLARCKNAIDLRFITEIKHQKPRIFQSNFPFKVYRRAGLSTVKLAADTEEERAKWITTIEEISERIKATPERDLEPDQRSSTLPNIKKKKSSDDVSTDSETCTTSSAPEQEDLIRPKKVSKSGFKVDSNQISSIKLKRTSSQMREIRDSKQPEDDADLSPQEKFGISLRRVNTDKPQSLRDEREKSPDYVEFKQKYNSLSLSRKSKAPNIPINANSVVKTAFIDNVDQEDRGTVYPSQILKENKEINRKRSPSPNIPISKGVESVIKNADEESVKETITAQNSLNVREIRHATLAVVPRHESVAEELKFCEQTTTLINEKQINKDDLKESHIVDIQTDVSTIPTIFLSEQDNFESEFEREDPNSHVALSDLENNHVKREETAFVIDVNEPLINESLYESIQESTTPSVVHLSEESSETTSDPLKLNAIKKFIREMKSDPSDTDTVATNNLNVSVVDSSVENSPAIYPRKTSKEMKSEDSITNIRLSTFSYGSQLSTESEEPLPRLNFLGKIDRSSTGSSVLKEASSSSDEHKSEKTSDSEEVLELSGIVREKSKESKARPDSSNSLVAARSSLIAPEFTVVEEYPEESISAIATNISSDVSGEQIDENRKSTQIEFDGTPEAVGIDQIVENKAEIKILDDPKSEVTTEIGQESAFLKELFDSSNITFDSDVKIATMVSDRTVHSSNEAETSYCNKIEMTLSTNTIENTKVKTPLCKQISSSLQYSDETVKIDNIPGRKSPVMEKIPKILTENNESSTDNTDDSDGEIEILENQETCDFFPSYGGADIEYRKKEDYLNIEQPESIRTSGIVGLKEFLKNNEDSSSASLDVKSAISRLGHSPAIEKLKDELPKQQLQ